MVNSNHYFYFCAVFTIFTNSASVIAYFDSYTDIVVTGMNFINYDNANHPMEICKSRMANDAIWIGYYDDVIPEDICRKHISCRANDVPDREFYGVYPSDGARCQRRTQNQYNNFGYGCYKGSCVPITCLDEICQESHDRMVESHNQLSQEQNTPVSGQDRSYSPYRKYHYTFVSSEYRLPSRSSSYVQPQNDDQFQSDGQAQNNAQPQNDSHAQIIKFNHEN